jgi:hypothetical protein
MDDDRNPGAVRAWRKGGDKDSLPHLCAAYGSKLTVAVSVAVAPVESVTVRVNV